MKRTLHQLFLQVSTPHQRLRNYNDLYVLYTLLYRQPMQCRATKTNATDRLPLPHFQWLFLWFLVCKPEVRIFIDQW